jgi:MFS family permease
MAAELIGAKLIGPLYGNSLYIWAAVLGITLLSLTLGYYLGGWLSARFSKLVPSLGILALLGGGLMLSVMPWLSLSIMTQLVEGDIVFGAVVSLLVFLFPTLFLFGLSTPLFISLLNQEASNSGKTSGFVYAISTFGGIISTFSFGFYLMGNFGITWPSFYLGLLVVLACCISIIWSRRYMLFLSLLSDVPPPGVFKTPASVNESAIAVYALLTNSKPPVILTLKVLLVFVAPAAVLVTFKKSVYPVPPTVPLPLKIIIPLLVLGVTFTVP